MKKIIGIILLSLPFLGIIYVGYLAKGIDGVKVVSATFGIVALVIVVLYVGIGLLHE